MYGLGLEFWSRLFVILGIALLLISLFNALMRKVLNVKRRKFFSYNHVNDRHKKLDWFIRIGFIGMVILSYPFTLQPYSNWFLQPWFLIFVFFIASETVRAIMEYKYAKNRRDYLYTLSSLLFVTVLLTILFSTQFFGFID
ncbi:DUF4181 domain-containing protein [Radiobacillus deserti]|uniref:DUF4181 domain-containing protein n=1 Tax=Radiobacillus deserti TaxID=2594883 RepID=A0A516KHA4_9BACI|nr:DUF4181 domain-containing protein [Radiobacillus deserti]QDP40759.1 DUF4181 domain-containing protein [Radiobacillus deserti]